ncbi:hypothetical protein ACLI1A_08130 [Flavobacterium sp. RHBU_3]|uniref:hypothetical protein n=1 Tax=Flavobacterium sp. RHBU_3 TaxID=3391184 RepID=UPI003984DEB5
MKTVLNFFSPNHYGKTLAENIPDNIKDVISQPYQLFKATFSIITTVFLLILILPQRFVLVFLFILAIAGTPIVLAMAIFYILFLATLFTVAITNRPYALLILQKSSILLLNIPISFIYINIIKTFN